MSTTFVSVVEVAPLSPPPSGDRGWLGWFEEAGGGGGGGGELPETDGCDDPRPGAFGSMIGGGGFGREMARIADGTVTPDGALDGVLTSGRIVALMP